MFTQTRSHSHRHKCSCRHSWTHMCTFLLAPLHKRIRLDTMWLVWRRCTKRVNPIFSQPFSPIPNDPHKLGAWGKRGDMARQDFYGFSHNRSGLQWCFYGYCITPPTPTLPLHPPLPTRRTTKETNKVFMFNGLDALIPSAATKLSQLRAA